MSASIALVFVLTGAAAVDVKLFAVTVVILLSICLPASKVIARVVEKKKNTFSVGAASFLGIILGPWLVLLSFVFPTSGHAADLQAGLQLLWNPAVILFLQGVGVVMFLRTGRSQVTGSGVSFYVNEDQI